MKIYGGRAGFNSVSFTGDRYHSVARFKGGEITTEVDQRKENLKITKILSKIPFIRSFSILLDMVIEYWKRFLFMTIALFLIRFIIGGKSNFDLSHPIPINGLVILCSILVIVGLIIKLTPIGKYHAAEHMVDSTYEKGLDLTLEHVKRQSRVHKDCGTNLVMSVFISYFILFILYGHGLWVFLVSWSIGYEIWKKEPKLIWSLVLIIGKAAQYLLFTSKPEKQHLLVAIEALTKLEEKELANKTN
ncbi:DUF1385 domain-containing protein [Virgibacillus sp. C22-A2]|uniref:DUF1385 domain-containing protein n=1 Tax=Virgibacillus tibetensis TaxID=3042313 RepID=A0ABU6KIT9_9BACI|nr:DUF1385 domain-containing protein [Virgibacillus sp. C22-A2]